MFQLVVTFSSRTPIRRKIWRQETKEYMKILNNITDVDIKPGRLFAIMGGSGMSAYAFNLVKIDRVIRFGKD